MDCKRPAPIGFFDRGEMFASSSEITSRAIALGRPPDRNDSGSLKGPIAEQSGAIRLAEATIGEAGAWHRQIRSVRFGGCRLSRRRRNFT